MDKISPWSAEFYGVTDSSDQIEHYGNRNSGRYPRGSGKHPDSTRPRGPARQLISDTVKNHIQRKQNETDLMRQKTKQARTLLKVREKNDKIIKDGLKRLHKMSPEEANDFLDKMQRFSEVDRFSEERIRSIAETKMSVAKTYVSKMETVDATLKTVNTGINVAKSVSKLPLFKNLSEALGPTAKAVTERVINMRNANPDINVLSKKYADKTGMTKEDAQKELTRIIATTRFKKNPKKIMKGV